MAEPLAEQEAGRQASHLAALSRLCSSISMEVPVSRGRPTGPAELHRRWLTEVEALITGTNTRVM